MGLGNNGQHHYMTKGSLTSLCIATGAVMSLALVATTSGYSTAKIKLEKANLAVDSLNSSSDTQAAEGSADLSQKDEVSTDSNDSSASSSSTSTSFSSETSSGQSSSSSSLSTELEVDGHQIEVPDNGRVRQVIENEDGKTKVDVKSQHKGSSSSVNIEVNSFTSTD